MITTCGEIIPQEQVNLVSRIKELKDVPKENEEEKKKKEKKDEDLDVDQEELEQTIKTEEQKLKENIKSSDDEFNQINNARTNTNQETIDVLEDLIKKLTSNVIST